MADVYAAFVQKMFDVFHRQGKSNIQHDGEAENLGAAAKALERVCFYHEDSLRKHHARLNSNPYDKALLILHNQSSATMLHPAQTDLIWQYRIA